MIYYAWKQILIEITNFEVSVYFSTVSNFFTLSLGHAEEYQLPYFDLVTPDPSFDEMKRVVATETKRPGFPNRWSQREVSQIFIVWTNIILYINIFWWSTQYETQYVCVCVCVYVCMYVCEIMCACVKIYII